MITIKELEDYIDVNELYRVANPHGEVDYLTDDGIKKVTNSINTSIEYVKSQLNIEYGLSNILKQTTSLLVRYYLHVGKNSLNDCIVDGYEKAIQTIRDLKKSEQRVDGISGKIDIPIFYNNKIYEY